MPTDEVKEAQDSYRGGRERAYTVRKALFWTAGLCLVIGGIITIARHVDKTDTANATAQAEWHWELSFVKDPTTNREGGQLTGAAEVVTFDVRTGTVMYRLRDDEGRWRNGWIKNSFSAGGTYEQYNARGSATLTRVSSDLYQGTVHNPTTGERASILVRRKGG